MPKPIKPEILKALNEYQQRVADILTKQGVKAHVVGDLKAYKKLAPIRIDFSSVQKGAKEFGLQYGDLLKKEGATMIHGKKVAWLADSIKETRATISNIINEGVRTGKGMDAIARELRGTLIRDKNYEYKRIARTETGNIQAAASDKRYKEEGVEEVDWLCGPNPCPKCAQHCGKRYKINEAPALLLHPNGTCDKAPVVTRKVRTKIDKKSVETKKKQEALKLTVMPPRKKPPMKKPLPKKEDPLKQLKKDERKTADELWKETKRDGNEHLKLTNSKISYATGDAVSVHYRIPRTPFDARHTHPDWDSPLSGVDLSNFLGTPNMQSTGASSPNRVYVALKQYETKRFLRDDRKILADEFKAIAGKINNKATVKLMVKTGKGPTQAQTSKIWHDALDEANKIFAKKYKYTYISFGRKG